MNYIYFYSPCQNGHVWTYAGSSPECDPWEGQPCDCGLVRWHKEKCSECGGERVKPLPNYGYLDENGNYQYFDGTVL